VVFAQLMDNVPIATADSHYLLIKHFAISATLPTATVAPTTMSAEAVQIYFTLIHLSV
jgi:hypothetical protein